MTTLDLLRGIDFTALTNLTAGQHNDLVDLTAPATDKGMVLWTVDTALNTPDVPDPTLGAGYSKFKRYLWIRIPHSTSTSTVPLFYAWNDSATSVTTYLKWQAPAFNTTSIEAEISALDLRVDNLEVSIASARATANAANSTASAASTNATNALSAATAASTNATTALSGLNTPTTGVKDRVTSLETRVTAAESTITALQTFVTSLQNTVNGLGPVFIVPVTLYNSAGSRAFTAGDIDVSANVPSGAKAIMLEGYQATPEGATLFAVNIRKDAASSSMTLIRGGSGSGVAGSAGSNQGLYPITAARTFQLEVSAAIANAVTVRLVGYIL